MIAKPWTNKPKLSSIIRPLVNVILTIISKGRRACSAEEINIRTTNRWISYIHFLSLDTFCPKLKSQSFLQVMSCLCVKCHCTLIWSTCQLKVYFYWVWSNLYTMLVETHLCCIENPRIWCSLTVFYSPIKNSHARVALWPVVFLEFFFFFFFFFV